MSIEARSLGNAAHGTFADPNRSRLLESKYAPLLQGVNDPYRRMVSATLMENQIEWLRSLNEETLSSGVGSFTKYIFPILRRVFPNLIANEIMSVQPMTAPIGAVFTYEYKFADNKGAVQSGDNLVETFNEFYSHEYVEEEQIATGNGAALSFGGPGNEVFLSWLPVRPKDQDYGWAVTVTDGTETFTDNGNGTLTGDAGGTGTINYTTGQVTVTFAAAPGMGDAITVNYYYNSESNSSIPEVELDISMVEIRAQTRKLKARWSAEASDDLRAFHGVNAETELVAGLSNEIALEIDREMIDLQVSGAQTTQSFTYNPSANFTNELDSIRAMLTRIGSISSKIHKLSKRSPANYLVMPPEVLSLLEQLTTHGDYRPIFQRDPSVWGGPLDPGTPPSYGPVTSNYGVQRVGTLLNKYAVYVDPYLDRDATNKRVLVGLKGSSFMDAGSVYAPYIPLQVTPTFLDPDDQSFKKGIRTRYGKRLLRPEFYGTLTVAGLPT